MSNWSASMRTRSKFASLTVYGACGANAVPTSASSRQASWTSQPLSKYSSSDAAHADYLQAADDFGAAVAKHAKNRDNAIVFMEYLASPFAQDYFANGNNEFPAAKGVKIDNPALAAIGGDGFKAETIPLGVVAKNMTKVQQMLDRTGYK